MEIIHILSNNNRYPVGIIKATGYLAWNENVEIYKGLLIRKKRNGKHRKWVKKQLKRGRKWVYKNRFNPVKGETMDTNSANIHKVNCKKCYRTNYIKHNKKRNKNMFKIKMNCRCCKNTEILNIFPRTNTHKVSTDNGWYIGFLADFEEIF